MNKKDALEFAKDRVQEIERFLSELEHRREVLDQREKEARAKLERWQLVIHELSEEVIPEAALSELDLSKGRLTDACYPVLKAAGHGMDAREIVAELKRRRREFKAKSPEDSVNKMMQRDRRFYRPHGRGSYWDLTERRPLEEVGKPSV
jgi:hypothetical protein